MRKNPCICSGKWHRMSLNHNVIFAGCLVIRNERGSRFLIPIEVRKLLNNPIKWSKRDIYLFLRYEGEIVLLAFIQKILQATLAS